jgi:hypothetical protein
MKKLLHCFIVSLFCVFIFVSTVCAAGVEYNLPYPGLLPDSPIYFLKVARDNLVLTFIREEKQKAFYYLFLSDKRLATGQALVNNNQKSLGAVTVLKSQEYFRWAVDLAVKINNQELTEKLVVAGVKHQEVLAQMMAKGDKNSLDNLQKAYTLAQEDQERVRKLLIQKGVSSP